MISQDHCEIYIIFAEWSNHYLDYRDRTSQGQKVDSPKAAFLMMKEFGPFDISDARHQRVFGPTSLALIMEFSALEKTKFEVL